MRRGSGSPGLSRRGRVTACGPDGRAVVDTHTPRWPASTATRLLTPRATGESALATPTRDRLLPPSGTTTGLTRPDRVSLIMRWVQGRCGGDSWPLSPTTRRRPFAVPAGS